MAVLRDWLGPLNRAGLRADLGKAWLAATVHSEVIAVDDRVDEALDDLEKLSDTLRSSFNVLHFQQAEEQRARTEQMQHRIELLAAIFLVPTLVVGFYGANTWIPGQQAHWGFYVMVGALLFFSVATVGLLLRWQRTQAGQAQRDADERARIRDDLLRALNR